MPVFTRNMKRNARLIAEQFNTEQIKKGRYSLRNKTPVNYSGMDMNSEDEGYISVVNTKWNNGEPSYSWNKIPLSQANEIGDEEYCE